ncbi:MAG: flgE [Firmicutes bacterium]|nr:flgE [Bacillota bacterium]
MTGAMYAAVSGMKAHMNKLNVIGNNVSNVNTYGYKSARTTFTESLYTSMRGGSNGSASMGGVNPAQFGYGSTISTIDLDMSTKSYVPTGRAMDCALSGDGFFMVGTKSEIVTEDGGTDYNLNPKSAQDLMLTRVGDFTFDSQGYLTDGRGNVVYGFVTCANGDTAGEPSEEPGTGSTDDFLVSTQLVPIRLPLAAVGSGTAGDADYVPEGAAIYPGVTDGLNVYSSDPTLTTGKPIACNLESITIDGTTGKITGYNNATETAVVIGYIPLAKVTNPYGVTHASGPYYRAGEGAGECTVAAVGGALGSVYLDNKKAGDAGAVSIFSTGSVVINTSGLEASGTDLATEFSDMISTQRGYQANTRIITVTDAMLEELVNIKR